MVRTIKATIRGFRGRDVMQLFLEQLVTLTVHPELAQFSTIVPVPKPVLFGAVGPSCNLPINWRWLQK